MEPIDSTPCLAWWQDNIIPADQPTLPLFTHALHYDTCCIEGIRADPHPDGWSVLQLTPHLAHMERNGRILGLRPPPQERMHAAVAALLRAGSSPPGPPSGRRPVRSSGVAMRDLLAGLRRLALGIHRSLPAVRLDPRVAIALGARYLLLGQVALIIDHSPR